MKKPANFPYNTKPTVVVFRRWRDSGDVVALFPCLPEPQGRCSSFMHVGQHAAADYAATLEATTQASPLTDADVRELAAELIAAPYYYHLKPLHAVDIVVPVGARAPLTAWQLCQYIAAHSVDESTAESVWGAYTNAELVARYLALTREEAGQVEVEAA